jgi:hypothetical protein
MKLPRLLSGLALLGGALLLGGCGTLVSNVTTFHDLPDGATLSGSVQVDVSGNGSEMEKQSYASRVQSDLGREGLVPAASRKGADYVATLGYSIDSGRTYTFTEPVYAPDWNQPYFGGYWVATRHGPRYVSAFYTAPVYNVVGYKTGTAVTYTRTASLKLVRTKTGKTIWEGRNRSGGPENDISAVLPGMIDAMLRDFPGPNGKTRVIQGSPQ